MKSQKVITLPFAVFVAMAVFTLAMAAVPALAQNAVPPTARQAAESPAFASRLAHQAAAQTATRARVIHPSRRASPQDQTLYDNGPYNGTNDAWTINFAFSASDSFTVPSGSSIKDLHFVYWNASSTDLLTTVNMSLGTTSFGGGSGQTLTGVTNTFLGTNQYGYFLYQADYSFAGVPWSGSGYLTLSNACTTSGCSVSNPIYWDENSGPSTAYENTVGSIPSETFSLDGTVTGPPPCSEQEGLEVYNFTGGDDGAFPYSITNDRAGGVYGTTLTGTIFNLSQQGAVYVLTNLYRFAGGSDGSHSSELTVGQNGRLYGASDGGIQNCPYGANCGEVFTLQPQPNACLLASCSWQKTALYRFTGVNDAWNPGGKLIFDEAGNLYGISDGGAGAVYQLTPSSGGWTEKTLHTFNGSDGNRPSSLIIDQAGNLYGTTSYGGAYGWGVVYQLVPSGTGWTEKVLYNFQNQSDGQSPAHLLLDSSSGNLYGTAAGYTVFLLSPSSDGDWTFTILHSFTRDEGMPADLLLGDGGVWGITYYTPCRGLDCFATRDPSDHYGSLFSLGSDGYYWSMYTFEKWNPNSVLDGQGADLWGTTEQGGKYCAGAVWRY